MIFGRAVKTMLASLPVGLGLSFISVFTHDAWWYTAYTPLVISMIWVAREAFSDFPYSVWTGAEYPYGRLQHCWASMGDAERQVKRLERKGQHAYIRTGQQ